MPQATLGRLGLRGLVPRSLGARPAVALERALGQSFVDVVDKAFEPLADVDPGAMWVLRRVDVRLSVPASEPDPAVQSRRVAAGLARAVQQAVAAGPSSEAVRFASRADYVASYVRARVAGHGGSWVFERFSAIAPLPAVDALHAAARIAEVDLIDVVAELATRGGWMRLITAASPAAVERLAASVGRRLEGAAAPAELLALVAAERGRRLARAAAGVPHRASSGARARLELVAELAATNPVDSGLLAAIWRLEPEVAEPRAPASPPAASVRAREEHVGRDGESPEERPSSAEPSGADGPSVFSAAGAGAFLLLPDLEELLGGEGEIGGRSAAAACVRAAVLAGVFGGRLAADDPAVALAAGVTRAPDTDEWDQFIAGPVTGWARRLAADDVLGWRHPLDPDWVQTTTDLAPSLGIAAIALLRRFARHLPGFAEARASHLLPQVIPPGGMVRVEPGLIEAVLPTGPLHVLLALAGLDAFACRVPWSTARIVVAHEVAP